MGKGNPANVKNRKFKKSLRQEIILEYFYRILFSKIDFQNEKKKKPNMFR